jgi:hypothetical protein|tara:strand:+ start:466 stop:1281 length:816 start_codon:yes stop_codon:yes gene_type:complete
MKKGRFSKEEITFIEDNINFGFEKIATKLDRDPESVFGFIKKKVAKGQFERPIWMEEPAGLEKAEYDLIFRPYWIELQQQFSEDELKLFQYHWARIISQFKDDVMPTEELQIVDLIKLELLMNRDLKYNKESIEQISALESLILVERQRDADQIDRDDLFNMERQVASLKASTESLNKDYRELQTKKNSMLKEMKATREQRVKRLEDSKQNFTSWMAYLVGNPEVAMKYGEEMEKMRLAMEKEKERLSEYHKFSDQMVDQPFLTPETVKEK